MIVLICNYGQDVSYVFISDFITWSICDLCFSICDNIILCVFLFVIIDLRVGWKETVTSPIMNFHSTKRMPSHLNTLTSTNQKLTSNSTHYDYAHVLG